METVRARTNDAREYKNGKPDKDELPASVITRERLDGSDLTARSALYFAGRQTTGAHFHLDDLVATHRAHHLKIRLPGTTRFVVGVRNAVTEGNAFAARITAAAIDLHVGAPVS